MTVYKAFKNSSGLYYKHVTIINDDSGFVIKLSFKLIDAVRGIIYNRHMFIVQATEYSIYFSDLVHTVCNPILPQQN